MLIYLSSLGQIAISNQNVVVLEEKFFINPVSVELKNNINSEDSSFSSENVNSAPHLLLLEQDCFDTLKTCSDFNVFNKDCFLFVWYFTPKLVRQYILPYIDTKSEIYRRLNDTYPNIVTQPFYNIVTNKSKCDHGTFYSRNISHHNFLIILMNAKVYNDYLSTLCSNESYYKDAYEENGIYFKLAIPIPEKRNIYKNQDGDQN